MLSPPPGEQGRGPDALSPPPGETGRGLTCCLRPQEKRDKAALQAEVRHLRQDNRRLQQESQTATAQLRRFTQWLLHAVDKTP